MNAFLGIDTSNYTTSSAVYFGVEKCPINIKKLLPVKDGDCGLRQSDAVFLHTKAIANIVEQAISECNTNISAIGVSVRPRDVKNSYMPCFTVGHSHARVISAALSVPLYTFSHQAGHIMAVIQDCNAFDLIENPFIAFHVSGGTTEALLVTPDKIDIIRAKIIGQTLDLNAGQAIDRVGNLLGLPFPSGMHIDSLSKNADIKLPPIKTCIKDTDCCLSGLVNICEKLIRDGNTKETVSRYCIEFIKNTIDKMTENILSQYGDLPIIYSGGVMSNSIISEYLSNKYSALFASPMASSDNAVGIATLCYLKHAK